MKYHDGQCAMRTLPSFDHRHVTGKHVTVLAWHQSYDLPWNFMYICLFSYSSQRRVRLPFKLVRVTESNITGDCYWSATVIATATTEVQLLIVFRPGVYIYKLHPVMLRQVDVLVILSPLPLYNSCSMVSRIIRRMTVSCLFWPCGELGQWPAVQHWQP